MIVAIFAAPARGAHQLQVQQVKVVAGAGIVCDRHFKQNRYPGQNLTLVEQEEIERFNQLYKHNLELHDTRRNIVTSVFA